MDVRKKSPATLAALLAERATEHPDRVALRFLGDGEALTDTLTYGELDRRARRLATRLHEAGGAGERALLLYPTGPQYIVAFLACLYARVIAVPAYPPETVSTQQLDRVLRIIGDARPKFLLTQADMLAPLETLRRGYPALGQITVIASDATGQDGAMIEAADIAAGELAFLQYTSGSTSQPKGVQVTHGNLLANEVVIREAFGIDDGDTVVSWLPFNHDMGFIGGLLQPLFSGISAVLLSPQHFLERPVRWLNAISQFGGTVSGGPDFAYRLCVERIPEEALASLDLSTWRIAFSGSEPVRFDTLRNFSQRFADCGFDASALYPCYGLAEATLFVTGGARGRGIRSASFDADALACNEAIEREDGRTLVSSGSTKALHTVRIIDPATGEAFDDGRVGEICASGPSIAHGYWKNEEATESIFVVKDAATWLRTGDLGFLKDGELYVTGRLKDMIIVRGQNLYPQDIENAVESQVELVRKGRVAAFPVEIDGQETIGIAAEVSRNVQKLVAPDVLAREIRAAVAQAHREPPGVIVLLNPGAIPKTTSGKLQRAACANLWEKGQFDSFAAFVNGTPLSAAGINGELAAEQPADSDVELLVAEAWSEVLGVSQIHPDESFFALGGSSLSAARIAARIQDRTGRTPELKAFFETPTLRGFAHAFAAQAAVQGQTRVDVIPARSDQSVAPLSAGQQRMLFLWQLDPGSAAYNVSGSLRLEGDLDLGALQKTFAALKERHAVLRTTLVEEGDTVIQKISGDASFALPLEDLDDASTPDRVKAAVQAESEKPFDLVGGPLWRVRLFREAPAVHTLAVTLHHIISDAWSMNVLIDEFATLYCAFAAGTKPALRPLPVDYADYSAWVKRRLEGGEEAKQIAYWRSQLGDEHPVLQLPADRPRPSSRTFEGSGVSVALPDELAARVRAFATGRNTTLFAVLLGAFSVLLSRLSGAYDLRVGVPVASRARTEAEGIVGLFVNTLVIRSHVAPSLSFLALTNAVQRTALEAQSHQDVPFDRLVEVLQPERIPGQNPLFQVMFNHLQRDFSALSSVPGLHVEASLQDAAIAKFDLGLNTAETATGAVSATFVYSTDLFDRGTVARIADDFIQVLDTVTRRPDGPLGGLEFSNEAQKKQLLAWSGVDAGPGEAGFVHLQFERRALVTPDAVALRRGEHVMTYAQLNTRAEQIAAALRSAGVEPDRPVGVSMERSFDLVASLLGVLKVGGAYLPLDPDYPLERLAYMMEDSGLSIVLTQGDIAERLTPAPGVGLINVDALPDDGEPVRKVPVSLHPSSLAYVLYTSGTTGRPKGVANTHAAMHARLAWMQSEYGLGEGDTLLHKTPLGFDVAVWEIFWPLMVGAQVAIAEPGDHRDPRTLARLVREYGVSAIHFVPSMLRLFVSEEEAARCHSLRYLFSGGEALSAELQAKVLGTFPAARFDNRYGPTEALINATYWTCRVEDRALVPIGRPIPGSQIHILDAGLNPVPVGAEGDLYIGGDILARGYAGRPALTAERFLPNPFDGRTGSRLYRSGDRARWRSDGVVEYLGRDDDQVKIRGFRIELGEIEQSLAALPETHSSVVVPRSGPGGSTRLVAYVVPNGPVRLNQVRERLAAQLPEYMVPAKIVALDSLPLMPNGKLDRAALPDVEWDVEGSVIPVTPVEIAVAREWEDILQVKGVGLTDRFFDLGGHSLLATQVVTRLRRQFDIDLPLRAVFEAQDLAAFAAHVQREIDEGRRSGQPPLEKVDRSEPLPLSYSQERMWFLWSLEPESAVYNVGGAVRLTGPLDLAALDCGLQAMAARHEAFRTTFQNVGGQPVQQVAATADLRIERIDMSALPENERQARVQIQAHEEAHRPFDLEKGPLIRLKLVILADQEHVLLVTVHHIIVEGWAMEVFAREYIELYRAHVEGRSATLEQLDIQYADFAAWQRKWLSAGEGERQISYWRSALGNEHPVLDLPTDRPRTPVQTFRGDYIRFTLDNDLSQSVRAFSRSRGLTLFVTVAIALFILLRRYSGQSDLRIGYPVANRIRPEFERLIGAFLNTQVLRCEIPDEMTIAELVELVRRAALDAQSNQDVPFHSIVSAVQVERSASYAPLFQVMCNVQRWEFQQEQNITPDLKSEFLPNDSRTSKFDLMLDVSDLAGELGCVWTYSTDLFDRNTIDRMSRHWVSILRRLVEADAGGGAHSMDHKAVDLAITTEHERRTLLACARNDEVYEDVGPVHERIAAQARATPDATAVVFGNEQVSYAQLNARANRLAQHLVKLGVGPEVRVGIAVERSVEMVTGLLAILKAGGAYVPLDPGYPAERLAYMMEDSGIGLLLTQSHLV
ncbi:non-ribosomal peptide synthetase, partial [Paraburkholderia sp. BCC1885]|uniref:non-ribosomal peptide synthetase n=1 Tax=Paraburkholderia sp. BCC1885 TaxID=2562669 RepID=UPI0011839C4D